MASDQSPLAWRALIREGISIVLFTAIWYLLGWFIAGFGLALSGLSGRGGSALGTIFGLLIVAVGAVIIVSSTFIALIRVLGKAIAYGIVEADRLGDVAGTASGESSSTSLPGAPSGPAAGGADAGDGEEED